MWAVYAFICYLVLALLIPVSLALVPVWRKMRIARQVTCPAVGTPSLIALDTWHAVRKHTLGEPELLVRQCSRWPEDAHCGQQCLLQIGG